MQYSILVEIEGAIARIIEPVFAATDRAALSEARDWKGLFPAEARLVVMRRGERVIAIGGDSPPEDPISAISLTP